MTFKSFTCPECGGHVRSHMAPGRMYELVRGVPELPVPPDFDIPKCNKCGEEYPRADKEAELHDFLLQAYFKWQAKHIDILLRELMVGHEVTKAQIANICDVTPAHLSHLLNPARKAKAKLTLVRLLESFVANEDEFRRHLQGRPFACPPPFIYAVGEMKTKRRAQGQQDPRRWKQANAEEHSRDNSPETDSTIGVG